MRADSQPPPRQVLRRRPGRVSLCPILGGRSAAPPHVVPATGSERSAPQQLTAVTVRWAPRLHVPLHVQGQVVGPGERPVAEVALEGPVPGVLAVVAGEFVGAGELPAAALPVAVVRLLTCVCPQVGLQM